MYIHTLLMHNSFSKSECNETNLCSISLVVLVNPFGKHVNYVLFSNPGTTLGLSDLFVKIRSFTNFQAIIPFSQLSKSPEDFFSEKKRLFFLECCDFWLFQKTGIHPVQ